MKNKRFLALLLVLALTIPALCFTALAEELPLAGMKIGFAHLTLMDEWCVSVGDAMEGIGKELGAADVNVQVAEFDLEKQVKDLENFINQQYDAIFILTGFTDAIIPYIEKAKEAGIPVIAMDGTIEGDPLVSHIVWDQAYTGTVLGEAVAEYIDEKLGGEARIVCLDSKTLEHMAIRQVSFLKVLTERFGDKVTIVNDSDCQTRESAMNVITSISEPYDLIYAASDSNAYGAISGLQQKGLTSIPVFACGGYGKELFDALTVENGQFEGSIVVPGSSIVQSAYDQLLKYLAGDTDIPERVDCEFYYIDRHDGAEVIALTKPAE
ncbi:MAG: sugar ABC transporter substrate-binding protein [Clostridiales bacterium]|nr:sugar ABC transporter substrate-binding protein [Clostridiales bacterium]